MKDTIEVAIRNGRTVGTEFPIHCIRCGADAVLKHEQIVRVPQLPLWAYPITGMLIGEILELKAKMVVPLCKRHDPKNASMPSLASLLSDGHGRSKLVLGCLVLPFTIVAGIAILYSIFGDSKRPSEEALIGLGLLSVGALLGFFLIRLIKSRIFYPTKVNGSTIRLIGVASEYASDFRQAPSQPHNKSSPPTGNRPPISRSTTLPRPGGRT